MGTKELAGATHSPQIMAMLHLDANWPSGDEVPWCSAFVNYICWLLDVPRSRSLAARSWLRVGAPVPLEQAEKGRDLWRLERGRQRERDVLDDNLWLRVSGRRGAVCQWRGVARHLFRAG